MAQKVQPVGHLGLSLLPQLLRGLEYCQRRQGLENLLCVRESQRYISANARKPFLDRFDVRAG
ncbi:MAG: hypothetical protein ACXU9X_09055 [Thermodesulfobacteriota bacterium]